jgi:3-dehydroquinate dehydratase type I
MTSISEIRHATDVPMIATNRKKDQGGRFSGPENSRIGTLTQAIQSGFEYADLELTTRSLRDNVRRLKRDGAGIVISYHVKDRTPSLQTLESILLKEKRAGADICKIVGTARSYEDNLRCLTFLSQHAGRGKLVCFLMGRLGIPSRILSPLFGGYFTFASSGIGSATALGQIPITSLRAIYKEVCLV